MCAFISRISTRGFFFNLCQVRDSAAWTVARMCELFYKASAVDVMENPENLQKILSCLVESLRDEVHVAEKVLYAIQIIAEGMEDKAHQPTNALSPFFDVVVKEIIVSSNRRVRVIGT